MASSAIDQKTAAVIGAGVAGLVCAAELASNGVQVSVFDMGRGPGGRMSQRRERREGGADLVFDHGCQYFTVKNPVIQSMVDRWHQSGIVADWTGCFGTVDARSHEFVEDPKKSRYVGTPGMNSICHHLASTAGVTPRYGVVVTKIDWTDGTTESNATWQVLSTDGEVLGNFDAVIIAAAYKTFRIESVGVEEVKSGLWGVEAAPCFALMLALPAPLHQVSYDGALVSGSEVISWVARDSSKPGRQAGGELSECWVVHSTSEYAEATMSRAPPGRMSAQFMEGVAEEMLSAFSSVVGEVGTPVYMRAHRWGGAFPKNGAAVETQCIVDKARRVAACGDFCISPRVESAMLSGLTAAHEISALLGEEDRRAIGKS